LTHSRFNGNNDVTTTAIEPTMALRVK